MELLQKLKNEFIEKFSLSLVCLHVCFQVIYVYISSGSMQKTRHADMHAFHQHSVHKTVDVTSRLRCHTHCNKSSGPRFPICAECVAHFTTVDPLEHAGVSFFTTEFRRQERDNARLRKRHTYLD